MLIGSILLTGTWSNNLNVWVIVYAWCLFIYGIGVGGEVSPPSCRTTRHSDRQLTQCL
jgi:hypothetical protein